MSKILLLLLSIIFINSCNDKKVADTSPENLKDKAPAPVSTLNQDCQSLGFSNLESIARWKMDNGKELVICQLNKANKSSEGEFSGWINIYEKKEASLVPFIAEVDSELPSEFYSFKISKIDGTKVLINRLINSSMEEAGGISWVATEAYLECGPQECKLTPEKCINQSAYKFDSEAVQNLLDIKFKKKPSDAFGYLDVLIGKVVYAALAGDKQALLALNGLDTDGAAAETLNDGMYIIEKFIKLGCIKK